VGYEGTTFHISGPFAPVLGAQTGVVLGASIAGLMSPFRHLDNRGARQDGTTWYDSLYDAGVIDMMIELGGMSPSDMRKLVASWFGAWDPKKQGKLCWFSPERGEWWCNVRMNKNVPDAIKQDWYQSGRLNLTWSIRNDDAFWQSVDSVSQYSPGDGEAVDTFSRVNSVNLGTAWAQTNTGAGYVSTPTSGEASWYVTGNADATAICRRIGLDGISKTDNQFISVVLAEDMPAPVSGHNAYIDVWGRMDAAGLNGVRARFGYETFQLEFINNGTPTSVWSHSCPAAKAGDTLTLQCGVTSPRQNFFQDLINSDNADPNRYQMLINGTPLIQPTDIFAMVEEFFGINYGYRDNSGYANVGANYRGWGFGMSAAGTGTTQVKPPGLSKWSAGIDTTFLALTNIGDQDGWARYLCYGPGTFLIQDGPGSNNMISFGPLLDGQVALLTTLPRLQSVTDLSPPATSPQQQSLLNTLEADVQSFIKQLITFATNNNVPPLLQEFESFFGILPPQGSFYSLLSGRFTNPIPPMLEQVGPVTSYMTVQIQGGTNHSKVIAALTPLRKWPE
jgi:hypothetical protein